ncbi:hypothetical protein [Tsukamurella soli]|uniref:Uncharacterized protein n=1 Tax=Tsukamurella soli TaxID=644556 RepID=A0ABP8K9Z2_9ACTN
MHIDTWSDAGAVGRRYGRAGKQMAAETWPSDAPMIVVAGALAEARYWRLRHPVADMNQAEYLGWIAGRPARLQALQQLHEAGRLDEVREWVVEVWQDLDVLVGGDRAGRAA